MSTTCLGISPAGSPPEGGANRERCIGERRAAPEIPISRFVPRLTLPVFEGKSGCGSVEYGSLRV